MYALEIGLFIAGAALLVIGYRKTNRNMLVAAAVLMLLVGTASDFISGYGDGVSGRHRAPQDASAAPNP
ncbi:hypothetical protein [Luteimonas suaedae]|uniref:hypothetical protein n=1 Tax=Luteimonas suaedae TaxID=2605430 RepID=UPI0011EFBB7A|nr:hypothetical protein [Luteimonas suaedae]